ncbi:similar to Saccharomyces cerevisiae YLR283W Putative protein of unknown function [Maudiozyma barnettii]|nr:similar to Saccharomyces cerevisiae YLR283W Putative protein of unknown function [Kazachstania barnettii]
MISNRIIPRILRNFSSVKEANKCIHNINLSSSHIIHRRTLGHLRTFHTGTDNAGVVQEKSMLLKHPKSINNILSIKKPSAPTEDIIDNNCETPDQSADLIKTLSEQLIADTNSNTHKPTMAENEVDTMCINTQLLDNGFSDLQSQAIMKVMMNILNDEFYLNYNEKYLRDFEIDKQLHLFNSLQSEIKFIIANSRDSQFNLHHLQITRLKRDLNSDLDDLNEEVIDILEKDRKLDFNNQKMDNTLLYRRINMSLRDCSNKISINILAGIMLDIENLRWHTTRSGLVAIVILVFLILTGVNVSNKKSNREEAAIDRESKQIILKTIDREDIDEISDNI